MPTSVFFVRNCISIFSVYCQVSVAWVSSLPWFGTKHVFLPTHPSNASCAILWTRLSLLYGLSTSGLHCPFGCSQFQPWLKGNCQPKTCNFSNEKVWTWIWPPLFETCSDWFRTVFGRMLVSAKVCVCIFIYLYTYPNFSHKCWEQFHGHVLYINLCLDLCLCLDLKAS